MPSVVRRRLFAYCCIVIVLAPIVVHGITGRERWPWSPCPMFARYRQAGETRWQFQIEARIQGQEPRPFEPGALGLPAFAFWRQFFVNVYGSTDPDLPQGSLPGDDPVAFANRMGRWFSAIISMARQQRFADADRWTELRLLLTAVAPDGSRQPPRTIGIHDVRSAVYTRIKP